MNKKEGKSNTRYKKKGKGRAIKKSSVAVAKAKYREEEKSLDTKCKGQEIDEVDLRILNIYLGLGNNGGSTEEVSKVNRTGIKRLNFENIFTDLLLIREDSLTEEERNRAVLVAARAVHTVFRLSFNHKNHSNSGVFFPLWTGEKLLSTCYIVIRESRSIEPITVLLDVFHLLATRPEWLEILFKTRILSVATNSILNPSAAYSVSLLPEHILIEWKTSEDTEEKVSLDQMRDRWYALLQLIANKAFEFGNLNKKKNSITQKFVCDNFGLLALLVNLKKQEFSRYADEEKEMDTILVGIIKPYSEHHLYSTIEAINKNWERHQIKNADETLCENFGTLTGNGVLSNGKKGFKLSILDDIIEAATLNHEESVTYINRALKAFKMTRKREQFQQRCRKEQEEWEYQQKLKARKSKKS